jgi:hypothetical protein
VWIFWCNITDEGLLNYVIGDNMKNYEVTLIATVQRVVRITASDGNEAMDIAADQITSSDLDIEGWEIIDIGVDDAEECHEED